MKNDYECMSGRKTKKNESLASIAVRMAEQGLTEAQISYCLAVDRTTLYNWKKADSAFAAAILSAKSKHDDKVEKALLKRAVGFPYTEKEIITDATGEIIRTTEYKKRALPNVPAGTFWLRNRRPQQWGDGDNSATGAADDVLHIEVDFPPEKENQ